MDSVSLLTLTWKGWFALGTVAATFSILIGTRLPSDYVFLGGLSAFFLAANP